MGHDVNESYIFVPKFTVVEVLKYGLTCCFNDTVGVASKTFWMAWPRATLAMSLFVPCAEFESGDVKAFQSTLVTVHDCADRAANDGG